MSSSAGKPTETWKPGWHSCGTCQSLQTRTVAVRVAGGEIKSVQYRCSSRREELLHPVERCELYKKWDKRTGR